MRTRFPDLIIVGTNAISFHTAILESDHIKYKSQMKMTAKMILSQVKICQNKHFVSQAMRKGRQLFTLC